MKISNRFMKNTNINGFTIPDGNPITIFPGEEWEVLRQSEAHTRILFQGKMVYVGLAYQDIVRDIHQFKILPKNYTDSLYSTMDHSEKINIWKEQLKFAYDPELDLVNVQDLGLIYNLERTNKPKTVRVRHTLTSFSCNMTDALQEQIISLLLQFNDIESVELDLVFFPKWNIEMMSESAKLILGYI